jgi:AraC-like DNA-binding protein
LEVYDIADTPMLYREFTPPSDLAPLVRCVWTLRADDGPADPEPVLPDGHPELVMNFGDPMRHHPLDGTAEVQPTVLLAGVITRPFHLSATGTVDLLGVRFQPAGAWPLAPGDMDGLVDAWAEPAGRESWHEVLESTGPRTGADRVEALWEPLRRTDSDRRARRGDAVLRAANRIVHAASDERVGDVARAVGLSPRQLERRFRREVGVTPKVLSRVARFQRALRHLTGPDALPAAQAAVAAGYADQAHMIADVSDFSGLSPGRLLRAAQPLADLFTEADLNAARPPSARP